MGDSEGGSLASGDSSQLSELSAPSLVQKHGSSKHDRVPVHQPARGDDGSDDDEESQRSSETPRSIGSSEQSEQEAAWRRQAPRNPERISAAAAGKGTKKKTSKMSALNTLRPRSALEAGVSIDELFYRTYMGMQETLAQGRRDMRHVVDEKRSAASILHSSVSESAIWYTERQAPKLRPAASAHTRRSLCNFKAAAAFAMLYSEVSHKRKTEFEKEEQARRRAEKEESARLAKEEDSAASRAMERLEGILGKRIQNEKDWLAERERRRRKPLTDLIHLTDGAGTQCRAWPDRINQLQLARKQGKLIEKRAEKLFREWWYRSRAAADYVWPGDDNPFGHAGKGKAGQNPAAKSRSKSTSGQSPAAKSRSKSISPDGERPTTPSRVTWSSSQRSLAGKQEEQTSTMKAGEKETFLGDLPDLIELFRIKLFDSDGDMSYKTHDFLLKSKEKLVLDRQSHLKEAVALEKEFKSCLPPCELRIRETPCVTDSAFAAPRCQRIG